MSCHCHTVQIDRHRTQGLTTFSARSFQNEIRSLRTQLFPPLEAAVAAFDYVLDWEDPFLTIGIFVGLLWLAVADLAKYILPVIVFANVFGILAYGALSEEQKVHTLYFFVCIHFSLVRNDVAFENSPIN